MEDTREVLIEGLLDGVGPKLRIDSRRKVHIKWKYMQSPLSSFALATKFDKRAHYEFCSLVPTF